MVFLEKEENRNKTSFSTPELQEMQLVVVVSG